MSLGERAILRTVVYSSLFDWPLKVGEVHLNLQEHPLEESSILEIYQSSSWLRSIMDYQDGYLFLKGRDAIVQKRGRREERSRAILRANRWVLKLISLIPYVRLVAISGSAAQLNMDEDGDIDLFLVTRGNRVWSLAVTILVLTKLLGRRKMVCFNFVLSDQRLVIDRQDLFNANQIAHLKPVLGEEVYERFVQVNPFVARFLSQPQSHFALGLSSPRDPSNPQGDHRMDSGLRAGPDPGVSLSQGLCLVSGAAVAAMEVTSRGGDGKGLPQTAHQ